MVVSNMEHIADIFLILSNKCLEAVARSFSILFLKGSSRNHIKLSLHMHVTNGAYCEDVQYSAALLINYELSICSTRMLSHCSGTGCH